MYMSHELRILHRRSIQHTRTMCVRHELFHEDTCRVRIVIVFGTHEQFL